MSAPTSPPSSPLAARGNKFFFHGEKKNQKFKKLSQKKKKKKKKKKKAPKTPAQKTQKSQMSGAAAQAFKRRVRRKAGDGAVELKRPTESAAQGDGGETTAGADAAADAAAADDAAAVAARIADKRLQQDFRKRRPGVDVEVFNDPVASRVTEKAAVRVRAEEAAAGGATGSLLHSEASIGGLSGGITGGGGGGGASAIVVKPSLQGPGGEETGNLGANFTTERQVTATDKHMLAFIERRMQERGVADPNAIADIDGHGTAQPLHAATASTTAAAAAARADEDDLYRVPERLRVEDNANADHLEDEGIPQVDLGVVREVDLSIDFKVENIKRTHTLIKQGGPRGGVDAAVAQGGRGGGGGGGRGRGSGGGEAYQRFRSMGPRAPRPGSQGKASDRNAFDRFKQHFKHK
jgi:hypothetical protein